MPPEQHIRRVVSLGSAPAMVPLLVLIAFFAASSVSCSRHMPRHSTSGPLRDIKAVLADHDKDLLAIPGVVGVYVGLTADQKTSCLKVMLARKDPNLERQIPRELEGYPVVTEVTGEIHPLK